MMGKSYTRATLRGCAFAFLVLVSGPVAAADTTPITREQFLLLQQQNQQLQQQLQTQLRLIESLTQKVTGLEESNSRRNAQPPEVTASTKPEEPALSNTGPPFRIGKVDITGEGGIAYFKSQSKGQQPNSTFRIDEARVFLEAPVWEDVYFFSELDLATPETTSLALNVGELYLDFEDVSKLWGRERMLNIRAGRFYTPFGEEYARRFAIDNPLISHSVSDIWGSDDGVELYGKLGMARYAVAVQNGGGVTSQSLQGDKSLAGRVGVDPAKWLHLSVSAMRTGELSVKNGVSASWFGNGWFRSLGSPATTAFHANLVEGDMDVRLPFAQIRTAGGYVDYNDNDPAADNHRDVYYYFVEGTHEWTHNFYSAVRWSQVLAHKGFPIVGNGSMGAYGFGKLTIDYWRLSMGLGYHFGPHLLVKGEYSLNGGREIDGDKRNRENQFALEAAFKF
ncbi:MAG: hypothetical protein JWQ04_763 [Pedosphaera sp.]|nr:hypothetical protein [Pedosphaera sp.]